MAIVGAALATVKFTTGDVATVPRESVACAVKVTAPATAGVQAIVYGAVVTGAPMATPFSKKSTRVIVAPAIGAAEAVSVTGVPTVAVELLAGAVRDTDVATTAVTVTKDDVRVLLAVSITLAVRLKFPAVVGVQETE